MFTDAPCGYYKFDVNKDTVYGELVRAELHLLQQKSAILGDHYNIDIYYLLDESSHQSLLQLSFTHIDSTPGWKKFDITPMVLSWKLGSVNNGLEIRLTRGRQILTCEGVFSQGEQDPINTEPLLIAYTNDRDSMIFKHMMRERMLKEKTKSPKKGHVKTQSQERNRRQNVQNVGCHLETLTVTDTSISSANIKVLVPKNFNIGVCKGHCKKLQKSLDNPNREHFLSMHYQNTLGLNNIPSRCCVPVSYKDVSMMLKKTGAVDSFIMKRFPVQATKCGCL